MLNKGSTLPSQRILVDLIAESDKLKHVEPAAAPPEVLETLNKSIAQKQAQLVLLQKSLKTLKDVNVPGEITDEAMLDAEQALTDEAMLDAEQSFTLVTKKKPPPGSKVQSQVRAPVADNQVTGKPDPLTELAKKRPIYLPILQPSPRRPHFYRTNWRIDIPSAMETPILKEADDKLIIYPWRMRDHAKHKAFSGPSKLPTTKEGISRYFADAYFRPHPGSMYIRAFIGTIISEEELGNNTQYFFGA
jgi:hypothetical protein